MTMRSFVAATVLLFSCRLFYDAEAVPAPYDPTRLMTTFPPAKIFLDESASPTGDASSGSSQDTSLPPLTTQSNLQQRGGGGLIPAGYHPLGYKITELGERFLEFGTTCLESDVGRFLASVKTKRKTMSAIQTQWLEIVRVSKSGQSMRIYRSLQDLVDFCLAARLID